jgi:hypothetical protein
MSTTLQTNPKAWMERALASIEGPLPAETNLDEYRDALSNLKTEGPGELTADEFQLINNVLSFQEGKNPQDLQPGAAHVLTPEPATEPAQAVQDVKPSEETGGIKDVSNGILEALAGESEPAQDSVQAPKPGIEVGANETTLQRLTRALPIPDRSNSSGMPRESKEELKTKVDDLKGKIKSKKRESRSIGEWLSIHPGHPKAAAEGSRITELNVEIEQLAEYLRVVEKVWKMTPSEPGADESQPWFGKVYANTTGYLVQNSEGDYQFTNETNTGRVLREMEISSRPDSETTSPLDRVFNILHDKYHVDWWGSLAGRQPGLIESGVSKLLITRGPKLLKPVQGEWPTIQAFIDGMLRDEAIYFHCWMHLAVVPLYNRELKRGQALILAGPKDSGKSVAQNLIITPLLGRRVARPYANIIGRTDFNEECFEAEHLMFEDEAPVRDYETQQLLAAGIKSLVANEVQWCHGKGKKGITLQPFWRITVSVNDRPENLRSIPIDDETLDDKMVILQTYPDATVQLVESLGGQDNFAQKIREELPAYLYWLLSEFQIPEDLKATRFGMKAHRNKEIVGAVRRNTNAAHLLEILRDMYPGTKDFVITASQIMKDMQAPEIPRGLVPNSPITLGRYLSDMGKLSNEVARKETKHNTVYILNFPEREKKDNGGDYRKK